MLKEDLLESLARESHIEPAAVILNRLDQAGYPRLAWDDNQYFYPASMIKTPLALAALTLVHDSVMRLTDRFEVTQANMTVNDKPSPLVPGYSASIDELILLMITRSDNVATNMLYDVVRRDRATEIVQQRYHLTQTAFYRKLSGSEPLIHDPEWDGVNRNSHPASDAAELFELVARDRVPFARYLRQTLDRQEWNNKLNAGFEPGDSFAHKTGDTDEVTHDGGILDTAQGASYVLVVYTGMQSTDENNAKFGTFMSKLRSSL